MIESIGFALILLIGVVVAIRQRRQAITWQESRQPAPLNIAGVFAGRPDYEAAHREELAVIEAANLAGARQVGRRLGGPVWVDYDPCKCSPNTNESVVVWLRRYGPGAGVYIRDVQ